MMCFLLREATEEPPLETVMILACRRHLSAATKLVAICISKTTQVVDRPAEQIENHGIDPFRLFART
jgi:hypothetical protein